MYADEINEERKENINHLFLNKLITENRLNKTKHK